MPKRKAPEPAPRPAARALGLIQPGATLLTRGYLPAPVLPYGVSYRGPLWIYAGLIRKGDEGIRDISNKYKDILYKDLGYSKRRPLPAGAIIGRADLVACDCDTPGYSDLDEEIINLYSYKLFYEKHEHGFMYTWRFENIQYLEDKDKIEIEESYPGLFRVADPAAPALLPAAAPWTLAPVNVGRDNPKDFIYV